MEAGRSDGCACGSLGVATARRRGRRVSDSNSNCDTAISGKRSHRDTIARITSGHGKTHTFGSMQFARRHRSQGWAGPLFGCEGKKCRSRATRPQGFHRRKYWQDPRIGETLLRYLSEGSRRGYGKLGMMCLCQRRLMDLRLVPACKRRDSP
jgi:hypothetical protein